MSLKNMDITKNGRPLEHSEQHEAVCRREQFAAGPFVESEGLRGWDDYLKSIDLVRQISKKIS